MYRYSFGLSLVFADAERCYFVTVFENDPLYRGAYPLQQKYKVQGWVYSKNDDGFVLKLINCEEQLAKMSKNRKRKYTMISD